MATVPQPPPGARLSSLLALVATLLASPTRATLDLATCTLQAAWAVHERWPLGAEEAARTTALHLLWDHEQALATARRALLPLDPTRGLTPAPASPLVAAEALAVGAETLLAFGLPGNARTALDLAWPLLGLASREASDPGRLATVARALREVDEIVAETTVETFDAYAEAC